MRMFLSGHVHYYIGEIKGIAATGTTYAYLCPTMNWLHPWLLVALGSLSIPVVVHLFHLRRYKKLPFTNVRMLKSLTSRVQQEKRLLHRLVLAARLLALAALVFAFAGPFPAKQQQAAGAGSEAVCIFFDNSYSMEAGDGKIPAIEQARSVIHAIVKSHPKTARFCLLTVADQREGGFTGPESFLTQTDGVRVNPGSPDLARVIRKQNALLAEEPAQKKYAYIVSDFRTGMARRAEPYDSTVIARWSRIPVSAKPNISIDSAWLEAPLIAGSTGGKISFHANNHSDQALAGIPFRLMRDGRVLQSIGLDLPARGIAKGTFSFSAGDGGQKPLSIQTEDEGFPFDNHFFISLPLMPPVGVRINGDRNNGFLNAMLRSSHIYNVNASDETPGLSINSGTRSLSESDADAMLKLAAEGAGVVIIPAATALPERMNGGLQKLGFPPLAESISVMRELDKPEFNHPFFKGVYSKNPEEAQAGAVTMWFSTGGNSGDAEILQRYRDGNPAVLYRKHGRGHLVLFTMPWEETARDYLRSPAPLAIVANTAIHQSRALPLYLPAGSGLWTEIPERWQEGRNYSLQSGNQAWIAESGPAEAFTRIYAGRQPESAGLYTIINPEKQVIGHLALNHRSTESDSRIPDENSLNSLAAVAGAELNPGRGDILPWSDSNPARKWSRLLLVICILALISETVLFISKRNPIPTTQHA